MTTTVSVLGSTGSIGTQTLDVIACHGDRFSVSALAAGRCSDLLVEQVERWRPSIVVVASDVERRRLIERLGSNVEVLVGPDGLEVAAASGEVAVNAVMGFAGLPVTIAALRAGRRLALANKESLIAAAPVVAMVRQTPGAQIVPVDSEHCAIHQCLPTEGVGQVRRLILTASGGPFRTATAEELASITVAEALDHPTWSMGPKITVDSSTLMNKGLEVIEAQALFGVPTDRIDVVVHPQSIVHSMVEMVDGSTLAQLSAPDMRLPISYALGYPERLDVAFGPLDLTRPMALEFEPPDFERFACLGLAYEAGRVGGAAPAWLSAANEVAVEAFLDERLSWAGIAEVVSEAMERFVPVDLTEVEAVLAVDASARDVTRGILHERMGR
jgi:1-deoxy-D-xylulose-5-phosphate reductoisomerase